MAYADEGYEVAPLFAPEVVLSLREDVTEHIDRVARALHVPFDRSEPDAPFAARLERVARHDQSYADLLRIAVCTDAHRGVRISKLLEDPAIRAKAEAFAGVRLNGAVMRIRANVPALTKKRHGWHSDVAMINARDDCGRVCITCWVPLMDSGPHNGGLEVAVGRRQAPLPHIRERGFEIPDKVMESLPKANVHCPIGSALFLDRFTPHRALANATEEARLAAVVWFKAAA